MKITRFSSIGSNQWNSDGQLRKTMDKDLRGWNQRPTQRCLQLLLKLSLLDKEEHIFRTLSMSLHCQSHWSFFFLSKQSSTNTVKLSELKDQNTWSVDTLSMNENGWDILWGLLHGFLLFGPSPHGRLFVIWIKALPGPGSSQRNQWPPYLHQLLLLKKEQSMWLPWMSVHSFRAPNFKTDSMKNLQKNLNRGFLRTFHNKSTPTRLGDIVLCPRLGTYSKRHGGLLAFCPWLHSNSFCRQYPGTRMQIQ